MFVIFSGWEGGAAREVARTWPSGPRPGLGCRRLLYGIAFHTQYVVSQFAGKYGPVYSIQMGGTTAVVLVGYDVIHEALVGHADEFAARPVVALLQDTDLAGGKWTFFTHFSKNCIKVPMAELNIFI